MRDASLVEVLQPHAYVAQQTQRPHAVHADLALLHQPLQVAVLAVLEDQIRRVRAVRVGCRRKEGKGKERKGNAKKKKR